MATNEETLVGLEEEKQFQFNYRKRINGFKLIRGGSKHQAIIRKDVIKKIKPYDLYDKLMNEEISEWDIIYDFWYSPEGDILPQSPGLSTYIDFRKMPEYRKREPEKLWQLDEHSPFPDEVEIYVPKDRSFKGHIRPKGGLETSFTKDNIIEMLKCLPWKKFTQ